MPEEVGKYDLKKYSEVHLSHFLEGDNLKRTTLSIN